MISSFLSTVTGVKGQTQAPQQQQQQQQLIQQQQIQKRRDSKPQQHTIIIEQPQRDVQLYLQIPSISYKYMLELDKNCQQQTDVLFDFNMNYIDNGQYYVQQLYVFINEFRILQQELEKTLEEQQQKTIEIQQLKKQNQDYLEQLSSKDQLLQNLEETYMEKMQSIEDKISIEKREADQEVQRLSKVVDELMYKQQHFERCEQAYGERIRLLGAQLKDKDEKCSTLMENNKKLQEELDIMKDLRTGSLVINKVYNHVVPEYQQSKESQLFYLFTGKFRNHMIKYFSPPDLLSLMLLSKKMFFLIKNNRIVTQHIIECKTKQLLKQLKEASTDAQFFKEVSERSPEEVIQQGMAKFIAFRFQAGSYFNDLFKESFDFLEGKHINEQQQPQPQIMELFDNDHNNNNEVETTDLIGLNEEPQQQVKKPEPSIGGFFQKIKNLAKQSQQQKPQPQNNSSTSLADLSQNLQKELQSLGQVSMKAFSIPFLRSQLQQTRQDMHELVGRAQHLTQQVNHLAQRYIVNKIPFGDFLNRLQGNFARLLAFSLYLRLETTQLQQTTNYLAQLVLHLNRQMRDQTSKIEDLSEENNGFKNMNCFLQQRIKQLEDRVHKAEEDVLMLSEKNTNMQNELNTSVKSSEEAAGLMRERDQKIKLLVMSLKNMNQEKMQLQNQINTLYQGLSKLQFLQEQQQNPL